MYEARLEVTYTDQMNRQETKETFISIYNSGNMDTGEWGTGFYQTE